MTAIALTPGIKGYWQWQKALRDDADLREMHTSNKTNHFDLRLTALVIASFGENSRGCFASAARLAATVGCSERHAKRQRAKLVDLGWFTEGPAGGQTGRVTVLNIAIPDPCTCVYPTTVMCPACAREFEQRRRLALAG